MYLQKGRPNHPKDAVVSIVGLNDTAQLLQSVVVLSGLSPIAFNCAEPTCVHVFRVI